MPFFSCLHVVHSFFFALSPQPAQRPAGDFQPLKNLWAETFYCIKKQKAIRFFLMAFCYEQEGFSDRSTFTLQHRFSHQHELQPSLVTNHAHLSFHIRNPHENPRELEHYNNSNINLNAHKSLSYHSIRQHNFNPIRSNSISTRIPLEL